MEIDTTTIIAISSIGCFIIGALAVALWVAVKYPKRRSAAEAIIDKLLPLVGQLGGLLNMGIEAMNTGQRMKFGALDLEKKKLAMNNDFRTAERSDAIHAAKLEAENARAELAKARAELEHLKVAKATKATQQMELGG